MHSGLSSYHFLEVYVSFLGSQWPLELHYNMNYPTLYIWNLLLNFLKVKNVFHVSQSFY